MKNLLLKNLQAITVLTIATLLLASGCEGRNGEMTFPPRKSTFPLAMQKDDAVKPDYSYELKAIDAKK